MPANITVIIRTDGTKQFAWNSMPLYYYSKDAKAGDLTGDGVGGVWHLVKP
jgi:predicted lipoprotein with Yx(FWY)xxD motif